MKKAVVFTMDAVVALAIFLASLVFFSQFFTDTTFAGLSGVNMYAQSERFLATWEADNTAFFNVYNCTVNGTSPDEIVTQILNTSTYPANLKFYTFNGTELNLIAEKSDYDFEQKLVLRRFVVFKNIDTTWTYGGHVTIYPQLGTSNTTLPFDFTIYNPGPDNWADINLTFYLFNYNCIKL